MLVPLRKWEKSLQLGFVPMVCSSLGTVSTKMTARAFWLLCLIVGSSPEAPVAERKDGDINGEAVVRSTVVRNWISTRTLFSCEWDNVGHNESESTSL